MTTYKFLQYNTDSLRLGWDVLERQVEKADIILLQRFPKEEQKKLCNIIDRVFITDSVGPNQLSLVIGKTEKVSSIGSLETITLPSQQLITAIANPWQGCTALKGVIGSVNIISVLPCFPEITGEYPVLQEDSIKDVKFLLEKYKDSETIIAGDFHMAPNKEMDDMLKEYGFTSYLDNYDTFKSREGMMNLDRLISNFDIDISDIIVHNTDIDIEQGHFPISYTLNWDTAKTKKSRT